MNESDESDEWLIRLIILNMSQYEVNMSYESLSLPSRHHYPETETSLFLEFKLLRPSSHFPKKLLCLFVHLFTFTFTVVVSSTGNQYLVS